MLNKHSTLYKTVLSVVIFAVMVVAHLGVMDKASEEYTDSAFKRALITFGIARGINGVISVAQGTEVALHPAGFGVNFTPGQILDPINDIIEQFSWIMLASSASLGIQKILLGISASIIVSVLLSVLLLAVIILQWKSDLAGEGVYKTIITLTVILFFIRFSVPMTAVSGEALYHFYLEEQYTESTEKLEQAQKIISQISSEENKNLNIESKDGLIEKAKRFFESTSLNLSLDARFEQYKDSAALATEQAINLIVVFLIQTVLFPLFFIWFVYKGLRQVWKNLVFA